MNSLYSHSTAAPVALTRGTSSTMRTEFDAIAAAFDAVSNSVMGVGVESGSGNAFVLTLTPAPTVAPTKGTFAFLATHANTGAATLQLGALPAIPLLSNDGTTLASGCIASGELVTCYTNGTNAYLLGATKSYVDSLSFASSLPAQGGNAGKFVVTNGTAAFWSNTVASITLGNGTVAAPSFTLGDVATGLYRPALNQMALAINGVLTELNQASGKTVYGNVVFGSGITFPANMTNAQLLALTGAPKADGTGASGSWGISITGSAASATTAVSATTAGTATNSTQLGGVAAANYAQLAVAQSFTAAQRGAVSALTYGATVTPDFAVSNNFSLALTGNATLANPTNLTAGQSGVIVVTQDATGSRTLSYGSYFKFAGGASSPLSTAAGTVDYLTYFVESSTRVFISYVKGVA